MTSNMGSGNDDDQFWDDAAMAQFYPGGVDEYTYTDGAAEGGDGEEVPPQQEEIPEQEGGYDEHEEDE